MGRQVLKLSTSHDSVDEVASLMEEIDGAPSNKKKLMPASASTAAKLSTSPTLKVVVFLLFGLGLLFATDTLEITSLRRKGGNANKSIEKGNNDKGSKNKKKPTPVIQGSVIHKRNATKTKADKSAAPKSKWISTSDVPAEPRPASEAKPKGAESKPAPEVKREELKPAPEAKKDEPKQEAKEEPKSEPEVKKEEPKPAPEVKKEEPKPAPEVKKEEPKPAPEVKKEEPKPTEAAPVGDSSLSRHTYKRRGQPLSGEAREALVTEWGRWSWDDEPQRPVQDALYEKYPNRDVPEDAWPDGAWQRDKAYLERYFSEGLALVERAQEAILAEYGHGVKTHPGEDKSFQARSAQFKVNIGDAVISGGGSGGYFSKSSWEGLKRRLLHAMMTEDSFNFAMGGHSAAAGHGNHFSQSYTLQVAWIMEPIFARLGVKHESRNFGNGGMGTSHHALAAGSMYGPDVSLLMWDSGMTERENHIKDMFARQGLIGGKKVPVLLSVPGSEAIAKISGADIGNAGSGMATVPSKNALEQVKNATWATKYLNCEGQLQKDVCRPNEYNGTCWISRPDYQPKGQKAEPGGRAGWHPGNRHHQIRGRAISFMLLTAMKEVLTEWRASEDFVVADNLWHVTSMYESVRTKIITGPVGACGGGLSQFGLQFLCNTPMQARSNFSPRAYPELSTIRNVMPEAMKKLLPAPRFNVWAYPPPDVFNPSIHPPPGEVDVLSIVESGPDFRPIVKPDYSDSYAPVAKPMEMKVVPGKGVGDNDPPGRCDGTLDSWCKRVEGNDCLLSGHNDQRTGILFDGLSGWVVTHIPRVKHGRIIIKFHSWEPSNSNSRTNGFKGINNEAAPASASPEPGAARRLRGAEDNVEIMDIEDGNELDFSPHRKLYKAPPYCPEFTLEYAVDGNVTSLSLDQYNARYHRIQRVVETITIMSDPEYTGGKEKDVEVAVRISGCGRTKTFSLTHIYWA